MYTFQAPRVAPERECGPVSASSAGELPETPRRRHPAARSGPAKALGARNRSTDRLASTWNKSPRGEGLVADPRAATAASQPEYIRMCGHRPEARGSYHLWTWMPGSNVRTRHPYYCNSWRCEHCERRAASVLFARIKESFEPFKPDDCVFIVLTLESLEHARAKHDLAGVYRDFGSKAERWRKRVDRWLAREGLGPIGSQWVSTVEAHRTGVPHINILAHAPELARRLREERAAKLEAGLTAREATLLDGAMAAHAKAVGFGWSSTAEAVRMPAIQSEGVSALAGYIAKVAKRTDAIHGEIAKLTQLPLQAPKNFRRVRAGKGFLVPKRKGNCTGTVVRRKWTAEGDQTVEPLVQPKSLTARLEVQLVCQLESALARADEQTMQVSKTWRVGREQKTRVFRGSVEVRAGPGTMKAEAGRFGPGFEPSERKVPGWQKTS